MKKPVIEAHPSLVIVHNPSKDRLLLSVYDAGYRGGNGPYPLTANVIGGNPDIRIPENGPSQVLVREVTEEFDPRYQNKHPQKNAFGQRVAWADQGVISDTRDAIIRRTTRHQDFLVQATPFGPGTAGYAAICSYFISQVSEKIFQTIEASLRRQKTLVTEGLVGVFTLDELERDPRGPLATAHATAPVLNYTFGTTIPLPEEVQAEPIGTPRASFRSYLTDFTYSKDQRPNYNTPEKMDPSFHEVLFGPSS